MSYDPLIGTKLGSYEVLEAVGEGGMARIYRGFHQDLERQVAIKVVNWGLQEDPAFTERFRREAQAIASLRHPNIVQIFDFGKHEHGYFMVMEFIEGGDVAQFLNRYRQDGTLPPPDEIVRIIKYIGQALDYAHAQDVIHRDIKPSNIMLSGDGQPILTDFGLVMLPAQKSQVTLGNTFGTPHYVAPEQAISSAASVPASDIYSLGIILFEMVTGQLPFDDESPLSVALKHVSDPPPLPTSLNPDVPLEVEKVILKALAKDPNDRFGSASDFSLALEGAWSGNPEPITLPSSSSSLPLPANVSTVVARPRPITNKPTLRSREGVETYRPISPPRKTAPTPVNKINLPLAWLVGASFLGASMVVAVLWFLGIFNNLSIASGAVTPTTQAVALSGDNSASSDFSPPTSTATSTSLPTVTPTPTPAPTDTPTSSPTVTPTATPVPTETPTPIPTPSPTNTPIPPTPTPVVVIIPATPTPAELTRESLRGKILFQTDRDGAASIYSMNPDGSNQTPLPSGGDSIYADLLADLPVSPNGSEYVVPRGPGQLDLWLVNRADGAELRITSTAGNEYDVAWSPVDQRIVYVTEERSPGDISLINLGGSAITQLTDTPAQMDRHPTWSPDGTQIAFWSTRGFRGNQQIWLLDLQTNEVRSLSDNAFNDRNPVWVH